MDRALETYGTRGWFESLVWQDRWITLFAGWWAGHFGKPNTIVDYGAGRGTWPHTFMQMGSKQSWGIELYEMAREFIPADVITVVHDLRKSGDEVVEKADLVICLEVAEHLAPQYVDTLCKTLVDSTEGLLLFSAAQPGQQGTGHINLQEPSYWRNHLERTHEIGFSPQKTVETQRAFDNIQNGLFDFLTRNLQVFAKV